MTQRNLETTPDPQRKTPELLGKFLLLLLGVAACVLVGLHVAARAAAARPGPVVAGCDRLAGEYATSGASAAACVECVSHGSEYMWFVVGGGWACNDPRW
jgi:hypothetical protein